MDRKPKPTFSEDDEEFKSKPAKKNLSSKLLNPCKKHDSNQIGSICLHSNCHVFLCPQCFDTHKHRRKEDLSETLLAKYRFLRFLGKGGCGKVFSVEEDLERFAMKVVDVFAGVDESFTPKMKQIYCDEYMKEAEMHRSLRNQFIINYYDHFYIKSEEIIVIKMELADGSLIESLEELKEEQALIWTDLCCGFLSP